MDLLDIKELMEIFSKTEISDFELEFEGIKVKMAKHFSKQPEVSTSVGLEGVGSENILEIDDKLEDLNDNTSNNIVEVISPMVGTFYRAPSPTSDPYVVEGDLVKKGQTLCIVEAMKLMNEIESEYSGKIVKILVENGQPVEYGEPLFLLDLE